MVLGRLRFWEPEETVGTLWHDVVTPLDDRPRFPDAAVDLDTMRGRIGVLFRGLGGPPGTEFREATAEITRHRRSFLRRLGHAEERIEHTSFDGECLRLPARIDSFPDPALNLALYLWLAVWVAYDDEPTVFVEDPLDADLATLARIGRVEARLRAACPGLVPTRVRLGEAVDALRPPKSLPDAEAHVEAMVRALLLGTTPPAPPTGSAPGGYRPFEPVALWPTRRPTPAGDPADTRTHQPGAPGAGQTGPGRRRGRRRKSDQAKRPDSLILHRFESILSWAEFLNLNRRVEDDDPDTARKAADDAEEIGLADVDQRPATRLVFDLDLAPHDIDRERLSGESLMPEWDYRSGAYLPDHARVLTSVGEEIDLPPDGEADPVAARRVRAVKRQFEALRPRRANLPRQVDGDDLDMDALVRAWVDLRAGGAGSDRIYRRITNTERDLAVLTLIDTSRSTESVVDERPVIDIAKEALLAFGHGLAATGDEHAIAAFSSLRRDRVYLTTIKAFEEPMGAVVERRIAALKPGFYTRIGPALRAASQMLEARAAGRRLLLVISDGKPNDLDHYEGRYGIEDTRQAVREARRRGQAVFGVTVDRRAESYVPHIFGPGSYAILSRPEKLPAALPSIYRQLVT